MSTRYDNRNGIDDDIYAQRINANGEMLWTADGDAICTAARNQGDPHLVGDSMGGAIITWIDPRVGEGYDIYAQHVNAVGQVLWAANGIPITTAVDDQIYLRLVTDGMGGGIIAWTDYRAIGGLDEDIYAQRINANGEMLWTIDGVGVCTLARDQAFPVLIGDGTGGATVAWQDDRSIELGTLIYAQRIDPNGVMKWNDGGIALSDGKYGQVYPEIITDGANGVIITWQDGRNFPVSGSDIYASHLTSNGALGETTVTKVLDEDKTLSSGWTQFGQTNASQSTAYDSAQTALLTSIAADSSGYRIIGWLSNAANTFYYSSVGTDHFVRAKYYIYADGQSGSAINEIPNFRIRVANRFAVGSILQVYHHLNADPEATNLGQDIRPSTSPLSPSVYRVDFDPIDVPQLTSNSTTEGFLRIFEAYEADPQANGSVAMTECVLGTYPALPDSSTLVPVTQNGLLKSYRPGLSDGGDFGDGNIALSNSAISIMKVFNGAVETTGALPSVTISNAGVTLETLAVETDRFGAAALDVFNDIEDQTNHLTRARIEPGKQYRIRFHTTSTKQSNTQSSIRFRARTLKFQYTASMEVGGSQAASVANNTLAAQALPGIGNQIPAFDRINLTENGGWYNVMMVTPMNSDIQSAQPHIAAQDPPGVDTSPGNNSKSRRDLQFGMDVIDTFTTVPNKVLESGQMTVDRVDIEKYDLVPD